MAYIRVSGKAILKLLDGSMFEIQAAEVELDSIGGSERGMGPEHLYFAEIFSGDDNDSPGIRWTISEYPEGALNHVSREPLNGAEIVEDFEFEMVHEPDQE